MKAVVLRQGLTIEVNDLAVYRKGSTVLIQVFTSGKHPDYRHFFRDDELMIGFAHTGQGAKAIAHLTTLRLIAVTAEEQCQFRNAHTVMEPGRHGLDIVIITDIFGENFEDVPLEIQGE